MKKILLAMLLCISMVVPQAVSANAVSLLIQQVNNAVEQAATQDEIVNAIVYVDNSADLNEVKNRLVKQGVTINHTYDGVMYGYSITVKSGKLDEIKQLEGVNAIDLDIVYTAPEVELVVENNVKALSEISQHSIGVVNTDIKMSDNGIYDTADLEYRGEGMLIAIIDTGIGLNHNAFTVAPANPKYTSGSAYASLELNVPISRRGDLFKSTKIPFGYDYANNDTNPSADFEGSKHGVHVSGIAAGNNGSNFFGVAPDAQIAALKVFDSTFNTSSLSTVYMAMNDAAEIGADVINLSLGVPAGFAETDPLGFSNILDRLIDNGIVLCYSAGNEGSAGDNSPIGGSDVSNPDNGVVASNSTFNGVLSVANFFKDGSQVSSTSAWGVAPNLTLKPDIGSAGTHIQSAYSLDGNTYAGASGTSMAAPNVAGASAVLKQSLKEEYGLSGRILGEVSNRVLMSTAKPMTVSGEENGNYFSPRLQGAGFADVAAAVNAQAYLAVDGLNTTKLQLGDDPTKSGEYTMTFSLINLSNEQIEYDLSTVVQTEDITQSIVYQTIAQKPYVLSDAQISYSGNGVSGNKVTLQAEDSCEITVSVVLGSSDREHLDKFPAGIYVEGYVFLSTDVESEQLSVPYLAYYGDWTTPSIFDYTEYDSQRPQNFTNSGSGIGLYAKYDGINSVFMGSYQSGDYVGTESSFANTLSSAEKEMFKVNRDYIAMGFKGVTANMTLDYVSFGLNRSSRNVHYTISEASTGSVVKTGSKIDLVKSYYGYRTRALNVEFTPFTEYSSSGGYKNNSVYNLTLNGSLEYGDKNAIHDSYTLPIYLDLEQPLVTGAVKQESGGKTYAVINTYDNHYARVIKLYYKVGSTQNLLTTRPVLAADAGSNVETKIQLTSDQLSKIRNSADGKLYIYVEDFARNAIMFESANFATASAAALRVTDEYRQDNDNGIVAAGVGDIVTQADTFVENGVAYTNLANGGYAVTAYDKGSRSELVIKEGTTRIEAQAFRDATALTSIVLPESLMSIGEDAFLGASSLTDYTFKSQSAPLLETSYSRITVSELHPYSHFKESYKTVSGLSITASKAAGSYKGYIWSKFFNTTYNLKVNVTYDLQGGTSSTSSAIVDAGDTVRLPATPSKPGYRFAGWQDAYGNVYESSEYVLITGATTFKALWTARTYTVTYSSLGQNVGTLETAYNVGLEAPANPVNPDTDKVFGGWYKDVELTSKWDFAIDTVTGTMTLYAGWFNATHTVTFKNGGSTSDTVVNHGQKVGTPAKPTKGGHTFDAWYIDEDLTIEYDFNTEVEGDITLYAGFIKDEGCGCGSIDLLGGGTVIMCLMAAGVVLFVTKRKRVSEF